MHTILAVVVMTVGEWITAAFCLGFPAWVMVTFLILMHYVKKPGDTEDERKRPGFPVQPSSDSSTDSFPKQPPE